MNALGIVTAQQQAPSALQDIKEEDDGLAQHMYDNKINTMQREASIATESSLSSAAESINNNNNNNNNINNTTTPTASSSNDELTLLPPLPNKLELQIQMDPNSIIIENNTTTDTHTTHSTRASSPITHNTEIIDSPTILTAETLNNNNNNNNNNNTTTQNNHSDLFLGDPNSSFNLSKALEMSDNSSNHASSSNSPLENSNNNKDLVQITNTPNSLSNSIFPNISIKTKFSSANTETNDSLMDNDINSPSNTPESPMPLHNNNKQINASLLNIQKTRKISISSLNNTTKDQPVSPRSNNRSRSSSYSRITPFHNLISERKSTDLIERKVSKNISRSNSTKSNSPANLKSNSPRKKISIPSPNSTNTTQDQSIKNKPSMIPLLRKASSSLLRKTSIKTHTPPSDNNINNNTDYFTTDSETIRPSRIPSSNTPLQRSNSIVSRKSSLGSKMKIGLTRMISTTGNRSSSITSPQISMMPTSASARSPSSPFLHHNSSSSPSSSSSFIALKNSNNSEKNNNNKPSHSHSNSNNNNDNLSTITTEKINNKKILQKKIEINLHKLNNTIPTIYITKNEIQTSFHNIAKQSNVSLDVSKGNDQITIQDYLNILHDLAKKEDNRLQIIENKFRESGWCSNSEINEIRNKRIIINKLWKEKISGNDLNLK